MTAASKVLDRVLVLEMVRVTEAAAIAASRLNGRGDEKAADAAAVEAMRAAAPFKSGDLRRSIGWTWGELPPGTFMIDEIRSGKNQGEQYATLRIKIYAGAGEGFYARFHEFGTKDGKTPARPFFYPTWKAKRAAFHKKIRERVRAAIKEEWANG